MDYPVAIATQLKIVVLCTKYNTHKIHTTTTHILYMEKVFGGVKHW